MSEVLYLHQTFPDYNQYYSQYIISKCAFVVCRLSAHVFNNNFSTSRRIFKVGLLYERYIHGLQMCKFFFLLSKS